MKTLSRIFAWSILSAFLLSPAALSAAGQAGSPVRRLALVVGSNAGGEGRMRLKYAVSDARSVAAVLSELGGVAPSDLNLLVDPGLVAFRGALQRIGKVVAGSAAGGESCSFIFYYSGHSDESGLLLGSERYPYDVLRKEIEAVRADVRIAILDSCSSGALTRAKGGVSRPAFLFDASSDMKGHAFITSSSADESAQESDGIGASFFTHYLVSALRGAADGDGRGVVTLNEAYAYAFNETLASTENTQYGPQHAAYDISLTGSGDLVLTDLRSRASGLAVAEELAGRLYVRDARGALVVELRKSEGKRVELGLPPGSYTTTLDAKGARYQAEIRVKDGTRTALAASDFRRMPSPGASAARGRAPSPAGIRRANGGLSMSVVDLTIVPDLSDGLFGSEIDRTVSINLLVGASRDLRGFEAGGIANIEGGTMSGFQTAGAINVVRGDVAGFQVAGWANYAGGDVSIGQSSGVVSIAGGSLSGVQVSGVASLALGARGGREDWVDETPAPVMSGAQISGVFNASRGDSAGLQLAGCFNDSRGSMNGAQIASLWNSSLAANGPQISVVNVTDRLEGAQIGLVNIAGDVTGTQVGLVNVSRTMDGVPVGLFSFSRDSFRSGLEAWAGSDTSGNLALQIGAKYSYTVLSLGYAPDGVEGLWYYGAGIGFRMPLGTGTVDLDALWQVRHRMEAGWYRSAPENQVPRIRAAYATTPILGICVVFGTAVDFYLPRLSREADGATTTALRARPQAFVGIRF